MTTPVVPPAPKHSPHVQAVIDAVERLEHTAEFDVHHLSAKALASIAIDLGQIVPLVEKMLHQVNPGPAGQTITVPTSTGVSTSNLTTSNVSSAGSPVTTDVPTPTPVPSSVPDTDPTTGGMSDSDVPSAPDASAPVDPSTDPTTP